MPTAIEAKVKKQVINEWLTRDSRDSVAANNNIGAGTITNIINEWKKGVQDSEYQSVRELAVYSKKEGLDLSELASRFRLYNYINKLGVNEDDIESFIVHCMNGANGLPPEKIIDLTNQLFDISKSESIPPAEVPSPSIKNWKKSKGSKNNYKKQGRSYKVKCGYRNDKPI